MGLSVGAEQNLNHLVNQLTPTHIHEGYAVNSTHRCTGLRVPNSSSPSLSSLALAVEVLAKLMVVVLTPLSGVVADVVGAGLPRLDPPSSAIWKVQPIITHSTDFMPKKIELLTIDKANPKQS